MYKSHTKTQKNKLIWDRLMRFYVIEDAEITRLQIQLSDDFDMEEEADLVEHIQRKDILHKMLNAVRHMSKTP